MAKTYRKHLARGEASRKGPKNRNAEGERHQTLKSQKQLRRSERLAVLREYR